MGQIWEHAWPALNPMRDRERERLLRHMAAASPQASVRRDDVEEGEHATYLSAYTSMHKCDTSYSSSNFFSKSIIKKHNNGLRKTLICRGISVPQFLKSEPSSTMLSPLPWYWTEENEETANGALPITAELWTSQWFACCPTCLLVFLCLVCDNLAFNIS